MPFALKKRSEDDPFFPTKLPQKPTVNANLIDAYKFLAVVSMVIAHVGDLFFPGNGWFRFLGQLAFPIFLFFVGTGTEFKIDARLVLSALTVALLEYIHDRSLFPLNILFSIILVRLALRWLITYGQETALWVLPPFLTIATAFTTPYFEGGTLALSAALVGFIARRSREDHLGHYVALWCAVSYSLFQTNLGVSNKEKLMLFFINLFAFGIVYVYRVRRLNRILEPYIPSTILIVTRRLPEFYALHWAVLYGVYVYCKMSLLPFK